MKFEYKGQVYNFPTSLSQITLDQRILFHKQYGNEIDSSYQYISVMEDGAIKDLELIEWRLLNAFKTFAFFANIPLEDVLNELNAEHAIAVYASCFQQIIESQEEIELQTEYYWNDETWVLQSPTLDYNSKATFGEFINAKQTIKALSDLGQGHWESLQYLAAIYLRKKDEPFEENLLVENGERMELMKKLPLDIAMAVGFFLQSSMSLFLSNLAFSNQAQQKELI